VLQFPSLSEFRQRNRFAALVGCRPKSVQQLQFLLLVFAGWVNRKQLEVIDYLKEENRIATTRLGAFTASTVRI
jgi:hypothetical protein